MSGETLYKCDERVVLGDFETPTNGLDIVEVGSEKLKLGDSEPFINGFDIAEVSGVAIDLACHRLGLIPPYSAPINANSLNINRAMEAWKAAIQNTGIKEEAIEVGRLDTLAAYVIFGKLGAWALRTNDREPLRTAVDQIEVNSGFKHIALPTYVDPAIHSINGF